MKAADASRRRFLLRLGGGVLAGRLPAPALLAADEAAIGGTLALAGPLAGEGWRR